ncbi:MarR family winged helix-turn-helix transcriptional regulator [Isoptericola sediminis]|uniref:MarR family transcriptional regulator n=1 Tax=Isoptericola sediminis TaxID=2733572 RepID=A0A849JRK0_9MICO|nr:MarR family transcriptional regulator [Isoptericola sediminis]NNU25942.1 MarR family transcriptional regulator [Isoptericola sediminis]
MDEGEPPRWLDDEQMRSWLRLQAVISLLPALLDQQLRRDAHLTHFEYLTLAMLSEAPDRSLRMSDLARLTSATLPRLSHVARRLEERGYLTRGPAPDDRRATVARLTDAGWEKVVASAPGHARTVLENVYDDLDPADVRSLTRVLDAILAHVDPHDTFGLADHERR